MSVACGFEDIPSRLSAACRAFKKWAFIILMLLGPFWWALEAQGGESLDLAFFNNEQLQAYRPPRPGEPFVFAIPNFVSLTPWNSGQWHELEDDFLLWSLKINAPGALSLSFGFGRFRLPAGASLIIRNPDQEVILGPFTDRQNTHHGQLWTPLLPGWQADLELRIPRNMSNHMELELTSINRGFRALPPKPGNWKEQDLLFSPTYQPGECNLDVACPEAESWSDEIRSVGLVTVGSMACSGTLLNNTSQDLSPYFLTAEHCGITPANAQSVVVYWNYQKSQCGGTRDGNLSQFTQGSFFRAAWSSQEGSDFALVELASRPQPSFFPHWAGWDRRSILPQGAVAIHHPQGAEKMISFDLDPLGLASSSDGLPVRDPSMYLKVQAWDLGTTEPGSSGCGLWNTEHRLVGQLWGGERFLQLSSRLGLFRETLGLMGGRRHTIYQTQGSPGPLANHSGSPRRQRLVLSSPGGFPDLLQSCWDRRGSGVYQPGFFRSPSLHLLLGLGRRRLPGLRLTPMCFYLFPCL